MELLRQRCALVSSQIDSHGKIFIADLLCAFVFFVAILVISKPTSFLSDCPEPWSDATGNSYSIKYVLYVEIISEIYCLKVSLFERAVFHENNVIFPRDCKAYTHNYLLPWLSVSNSANILSLLICTLAAVTLPNTVNLLTPNWLRKSVFCL